MPSQQQDMTYSPAHGQNQNQIVAAIRSSNPPHPDPSISPPSPPPTHHLPKQPPATAIAAHVPRQTDRSLRASQTSTVTTDIPGSVSGSSSGSYPFAKGVVVDTGRSSFEQQQHQHQQQLQHPQLLQQQQAAFVHPNLERASVHGSQYDGRRESHAEKYRRSRVEGWSSPRSMSATSPPRTHYRLSTFPADEEDQDDGLSEDQGENAFIILVSGDIISVNCLMLERYTNIFLQLKLSFLVPPYSFFAALYAFFILIFTTIISPLRLFPKSAPFSPSKSYTTQLTDLLSPPLNVHKSLIDSHQNSSPNDPSPSSNPYPYSSRLSAGSSSSSPNHNSNLPRPPIPPLPPPAAIYSLPTVILIHLLSPILSLGLLLAAWTAAFFWVFAMMLGNPDGTERRDDGRAAVLGVRNWWRAWLKKGG